MKITDRDMETLGELIGAQDSALRMGRDGVAPLDFGGRNGSHHGATATKLVRAGYAEHRRRGRDWSRIYVPIPASSGSRGSKVYRPTDTGRLAFAEWRSNQRPDDLVPAMAWACLWLLQRTSPMFPETRAAEKLLDGPRGSDLNAWRDQVRQAASKVQQETRHLAHPSLDRLREVLAS